YYSGGCDTGSGRDGYTRKNRRQIVRREPVKRGKRLVVYDQRFSFPQFDFPVDDDRGSRAVQCFIVVFGMINKNAVAFPYAVDLVETTDHVAVAAKVPPAYERCEFFCRCWPDIHGSV